MKSESLHVYARGKSLSCLLFLAVALDEILTASTLAHRYQMLRGDRKQRKPVETPIEVLRFVTAYKAPLESLVDITALSSSFQGDTLTFYGDITTWARNNSWQDYVYRDNVTNTCSSLHLNGGNGWSLNVELLLWSDVGDLRGASRPKRAVSIAEGFTGQAPIVFGKTTVHQGNLTADGSLVFLDEAADLFGNSEMQSLPFYKCEGIEEIRDAAYWGLLARPQVVPETLRGDHTPEDLAESFLELLYSEHLIETTVQSASLDGSDVNLTLLSPGSPQLGMPVMYSANVFGPRLIDGQWGNFSFGYEHAGNVTSVWNNSFVTVRLQVIGCITPILSRKLSSGLLLLPPSMTFLDETRAIVKAAVRAGMQSGLQLGQLCSETLLLRKSGLPAASNISFSRLQPVGRIPRRAPLRQEQHEHRSVASERVCVLEQKCQGHLLTRRFELERLEEGERALLHFVATGHGWQFTTSQCGEYCESLYNLRLNGQSTANVSQFRDWCHENPIGASEHGTWNESRNGWCPGSVEPGVYFDVTSALRTSNTLDLELLVKSNVTGHYELYSDYAGMPLKDQAALWVTLNLFIYDAATVARVRGQSHAFTAAEAALRDSSSLAGQGAFVRTEPEEPIDNGVRSKQPRSDRQSLLAPGDSFDRFDFEDRAPWFLYNSSQLADGSVGDLPGTRVVPVFTEALFQDGLQHQRVKLDRKLLGDWQRAALHLRVGKPTGLEMDHWDRLGAVGIVLQPPLPGVTVASVADSVNLGNMWQATA